MVCHCLHTPWSGHIRLFQDRKLQMVGMRAFGTFAIPVATASIAVRCRLLMWGTAVPHHPLLFYDVITVCILECQLAHCVANSQWPRVPYAVGMSC